MTISLAAIAVVVILCNQEENVQQQQLTVREEVDPDEPVNLEASISGISPSSGPFHGGNQVTIKGHSLLDGGMGDLRTILVGGVAAKRIVRASPSEITFIMGHRSARVHTPGPADVAIVSRIKGLAVAENLYTLNHPPRIIEVRPDNGPHDGGNEVVVRGRHITSGPHDKVKVFIDGKKCKLVMQSKHHVRVIAKPRRDLRSRRHRAHVTIKSKRYGTSKLRHSYTFNPAPAITHVSPRSGPSRGGNLLRIHGDMLTAGEGRAHERVTVIIGGKKAEVQSFSPNSVLVKAPRSKKAHMAKIEVRSTRHGRSVKPKAYKYNPTPLITEILPSGGQADGGDHITIRGRHLGKGDVKRVYVGSRQAHVLHSSADGREILIQTRRFSEEDEGASLPIKLKSTTFGVAHSKKARFKVGRRGKILSVSPSNGPCEGGTAVTITGRNLAQGKEGVGETRITIAGSPAKVLKRTQKEILVETGQCASGATKGIIALYSPTAGHVKTPYSLKFAYNPLAIVHKVAPEVGMFSGGEDVLIQGQQLCSHNCDDLLSVRIGNAIIKEFKTKSPHRIVFSAPSADAAGSPGEKTLVLHSSRYGRTVVPRGFTINDKETFGSVHPSNVPLKGGTTVTVDVPDLSITQQAESFGIALAGIPARIVSVSNTRVVLAAGDASSSPHMTPEGLAGSIILTASIQGKTYAKDLGLLFRYNPACSIDSVDVRPGAHGGQLTVLIAGTHLGYADEHITVDGTPAKIHRRERHNNNMFRHHVTVAHTTSDISLVQVKSRRTGQCVWSKNAPSERAETERSQEEDEQVQPLAQPKAGATVPGQEKLQSDSTKFAFAPVM